MAIEFSLGATTLDRGKMKDLKFKHVTTRTKLDHLEKWLNTSK